MTAQQLKNSILQMAVQGKLVPQDPNDEPASVLLERIRAEKERLIKEKKIKREKNPSVIFKGADNTPYEKIGDEVRSLADEIPFDIPDSWEWVRFGNIVANYDSKRRPVTKEQRKNEHGYYDYYGATGAIDRVDDYIFEGEYLMIGEDGGNFFTERDNAFIASGRFWANNHVHIVQPILCDIHFLKHFLDSCNLPKMGLINGIAVPKLNQEHLNSILVPLPPLSEQEAIVAELSKYAPLLDEYQLAYSEIKLLNDSFPERLKKSILQEAVQGKLVPQDPSDEPAEALLERIRAEKQRLIKEGKIKKDKHESVIFRRDNSHYEKLDGVERCIDDELPFEIPENWRWCRLKSIVNVVSARRVHQSDWRSEGVPFYRAREIGKLADTGSVDNELFITEALYTEFASSGVPHPGDLMVTAVGTLGKTYIVKDSDRFYYKDASVICFENFGKINPAYLKLLMYSPYMEEQIKQNSAGTTVGTITIVKANEYLIPLPPLTEQQRIVDQAERLQIHINKL